MKDNEDIMLSKIFALTHNIFEPEIQNCQIITVDDDLRIFAIASNIFEPGRNVYFAMTRSMPEPVHCRPQMSETQVP